MRHTSAAHARLRGRPAFIEKKAACEPDFAHRARKRALRGRLAERTEVAPCADVACCAGQVRVGGDGRQASDDSRRQSRSLNQRQQHEFQRCVRGGRQRGNSGDGADTFFARVLDKLVKTRGRVRGPAAGEMAAARIDAKKAAKTGSRKRHPGRRESFAAQHEAVAEQVAAGFQIERHLVRRGLRSAARVPVLEQSLAGRVLHVSSPSWSASPPVLLPDDKKEHICFIRGRAPRRNRHEIVTCTEGCRAHASAGGAALISRCRVGVSVKAGKGLRPDGAGLKMI